MYDINSINSQGTYDQYMQYDCLPKLLKRFSFSEKMRICNKYSRQAISFENSKDYEKLQRVPLPWCLETFAMLSIEANEYSDDDFVGGHERKFTKMVNSIWNFVPKALENDEGAFSFIDFFLPATALTQFYMQESFWIKFYRYWAIFSDNSAPTFLNDTFKHMMKADYYDYLLFGIYLRILYSSRTNIPSEVIEYLLFTRFSDVSSQLVISRDKYLNLQHQYINNLNDLSKYLYSVRPSYQFPFIEYQNHIYFPLPHLLTQNITSSLYYRLTENNNALRDNIGKYVLEPYLLKVLSQASVYDEVYPEQVYKGYHGSNAKSPDILARKGQSVLFLDNKSTAPSRGIRLFDIDAYKNNISITGHNIVKLYNQIKLFQKYNPFVGKVSGDMSDYWGAIVVLEDTYIRRRAYYDKANEELKLCEDSSEWQWLISHIKVVGLYEIERLSYCSCSIIDAFEEAKSGDAFNYFFSGTGIDSSFSNVDLLRFKTKVLVDVESITDDLVSKGLLRN